MRQDIEFSEAFFATIFQATEQIIVHMDIIRYQY